MNLRVIRALKNMNQADLASKLGVSQALVSYWECGKNQIPDIRAKQIEKVTGLTVYQQALGMYNKRQNRGTK